jgi:hypothetical protein
MQEVVQNLSLFNVASLCDMHLLFSFLFQIGATIFHLNDYTMFPNEKLITW